MSIISVTSLKKYFGNVKAVDDISFEINEGEIVGFLGPNGAGKTTTIRCMLDFLRPDEGSIQLFGTDVYQNGATLFNDIGYLSGEVGLYEDKTGKDHIKLVQSIRKCDWPTKLITDLDFDTSKKTRALSTGNKQKLGLILALMHKPKLLILDEPTTGLDPLLQQTIYKTLQHQVKTGTTVFMSSHNLAEAERLSDRVIVIKQGKVVTIEDIAEIKKKRLYNVHLYFDKKVSKKDLKFKGAEITQSNDKSAVLLVKSDITPVLKEVTKLPLRDIEIYHSNLEDVFLEFYK